MDLVKRGPLSRYYLQGVCYLPSLASVDEAQVYCSYSHMHALYAKLLQSCPTLCDPMDCSCQAPLSLEFSKQEYWDG